MQDLLSEMRDIHSKSHVCPAPGLENAIAVLTGNYNNLYASPSQRCSLHMDPGKIQIAKKKNRCTYILAIVLMLQNWWLYWGQPETQQCWHLLGSLGGTLLAHQAGRALSDLSSWATLPPNGMVSFSCASIIITRDPRKITTQLNFQAQEIQMRWSERRFFYFHCLKRDTFRNGAY